MATATRIMDLIIATDGPIPKITPPSSSLSLVSQGWEEFPIVMECLIEQQMECQDEPSSTVTEQFSILGSNNPLVARDSNKCDIIIIAPSPAAFRESFDWSSFPVIVEEEEDGLENSLLRSTDMDRLQIA